MILNIELFGKIAEALIAEYARVYRVNIKTNEYCRYVIDKKSNSSSEEQEGDDFFKDLADYVAPMVHEEDKYIFQTSDLKDILLKQLRSDEHHSFTYRLIINGKPVYHIMRLIHEYSDENGNEYLIIGVLNVDKEVHHKMDVDKKAHIDTLTGALNKNAYQELEEEYQLRIERDEDLSFGLVVCDVNNLKIINDNMGHKAGDEMIQFACTLLCDTFLHSKVYRIGGDEFVVLLEGLDYLNRSELFNGLRQEIIGNQNSGEGLVVATGMSIY